MAKILIGCKLPHGLTLELIDKQVDENGRALPMTNPRPAGPRVVLNGANSVNTRVMRMSLAPVYGKTLVDEEFWTAWLKDNKNAPYLKSGAVFAAKNDAEFEAKVNAGITVPNGFEPVDPGKDVEVDGVLVTSDQDQLKRLKGVQTRA